MCSGGWIGFQFTTQSKNSRGKGTQLRSLILFLHYLPFKENSFLSLTLFPFPFTCSSQLTMAIVVPLGSILFYISSFSIKFRIQKPTTPLQNQKRLCTFQSQKHESTRRPSNPRCPLLELSKPFPIAPTPTYTYTYYLARGTMLQHEEGFDTRNLLYKWCLL